MVKRGRELASDGKQILIDSNRALTSHGSNFDESWDEFLLVSLIIGVARQLNL